MPAMAEVSTRVCIPASRKYWPPAPKTSRPGAWHLSALTKSAPWASPEASPATSRTRGLGIGDWGLGIGRVTANVRYTYPLPLWEREGEGAYGRRTAVTLLIPALKGFPGMQ